MKKIKLIIISIICLVVIGIGVVYSIDLNRMKNNKPVFFSTWGRKYVPIVINENKVKNVESEKEITLDNLYTNAITKEYKPIKELPENYSIDDAKKDKCFTIGAMVFNDNLYSEFMDKYSKKESAFIRVAQSTIEGDVCLIDLLYNSKDSKIYLVQDNTRDEFASRNDRVIKLSSYEKIGTWNNKGNEYWVLYNGELPNETNPQNEIDYENLFIIATIN